MDAILQAFEEQLTSAALAAVQGVVASAKGEVARLLEAACKEREAGVREVEQKRAELALEVAAMHKVAVAQDSRVELEVGGVRFVTSVATLRSRAGSMLDALFSGRYSVDVAEDGARAFLDRDGELFAHVLAYLREGVVGVGLEDDVGMLGRLKREFGYFCLELYEEQEVGLAMGGYKKDANGAIQVFSTVERYDSAVGEWVEVSPMGQVRTGRACVVGGVVYVTGGLDSDRRLTPSVERYCPSGDTWSSVASMPSSRAGHSACAVGECMYVLGGHGEVKNALDSVLKYDVDLDSWSEVAPMPEALLFSAAVVVGEAIYVFGGRNSQEQLASSVYRYDVGLSEWSTCAAMAKPVCLHSACVLGGAVFVVGGKSESGNESSAARYDPGSDSWSTVAALPCAMFTFGLFVLDGCMHAVGRQGSFVYSPSTDSWSAGQALKVPRVGLAACTVKVEVDLFDGMIARARERRAR